MPFNINRVAILFRRELIRCFREYNIYPEQWQVLAMLWKEKSLSQTQIMNITLQDAPATSKMLAKMAKNDLLKIETTKQDKRVKLVTLTKKGIAYKDVLPKKLLSHFKKLLKDFPENKQEELLLLLKELRFSLGDI